MVACRVLTIVLNQFQKRLETETLEAASCDASSAAPSRAPREGERREGERVHPGSISLHTTGGIRREEECGQGGRQEEVVQWRPRLCSGERRARQVERERVAVEDADIVRVLRRNGALTLNELVRMEPSPTKSKPSLVGRG